MRSVALFVLAAAFSLATVTANARTITTSQGRTANEQSVNAVAGPPPKKVASTDDRSSAHPSKKALKKTRVTPPPAMHDPN